MGYVLIAALLSQFIQSSVIVFGIMAPLMIASCDELKINPSKTLFPMAIVCIATISALPMGAGATQFAELNGYLEANEYTQYVVGLTDPMKARLPILIGVRVRYGHFSTNPFRSETLLDLHVFFHRVLLIWVFGSDFPEHPSRIPKSPSLLCQHQQDYDYGHI